ncbi:MAG TPA: SpoIIE family protein phosphatase [Phycisphaerae bacterium]|nr:SpoIIE family protein phosphatase [Phycisphaerae bacterium]HNU45929.1 SpoIIE family protein phosphatase [Phycisphaerae bacterium]
MQILVVNPQDALPADTVSALGNCGWNVTTVPDYAAALSITKARDVDAVIAAAPTTTSGPHNGQAQAFTSLMRRLQTERVAVLMVSDGSGPPAKAPVQPGSLVEQVSRDVSLAELRGRLATIDRYHGIVKQLERELGNLERLGKSLNEHFAEVDQEMRLAARLQRDFLPNLSSPIDGIQFAALYHPAMWVSGDIYDVVRVDEEHIGLYIADAVGHGMAASLLTMFIKRTMVPKRIHDDRYEIISPSEVLGVLNDALKDQGLPNCQFVTAWYGLLNTRTLKLQYARGGHLHPLLFGHDGTCSELRSPGGLLGLFAGEDFATREVELQPGDKLLLFTDGVELAFDSAAYPNRDRERTAPDPTRDREGAAEDQRTLAHAHSGSAHSSGRASAASAGEGTLAPAADNSGSRAYRHVFDQLSRLSIQDFVARTEAHADTARGSCNPRDDLTILGLEVLPR